MARTNWQHFNDLVKEALGSGLQPWEFGEYTLREYALRRKGLQEKRRKELHEEFQHTRVLAYHYLMPYLSKSDKRKSIDQIVPDIYDNNPAKIINLKDHHKKLLERLGKAGLLEQPKQKKASGSK